MPERPSDRMLFLEPLVDIPQGDRLWQAGRCGGGTTKENEMTLLIIIVVLVLLFGGGGYYGYRQDYYGRGGHGLAWIILVVLILLLLFGHAGHPVL